MKNKRHTISILPKQIIVNDYVYVNGESNEIFVVADIHDKTYSLLNLEGCYHGAEPKEKVHHWEDFLEDLLSQFIKSNFYDPNIIPIQFMNNCIEDLSKLRIPEFKEKILAIYRRNI